jgi:hypothetical protein
MTIQEAINNGKPFKRINWSHFLAVAIDNGIVPAHDNWAVRLSANDILADDWQVESEPMTIIEAVQVAMRQHCLIRRRCWTHGGWSVEPDVMTLRVSPNDILATDWEIVP